MNSKRQSKASPTRAKLSFVAQCREEKGLVLIAAIVLMAILALVATVAVITTNTEIKISSNYKTSIQASYAAQAGYEEARARLRGLPFGDNYIGDTDIDEPLWAVYVGTSSSWKTTDDPDYDGYTPTGVNSLQSNISYWVKVKHKKWSDCTATEQDTVDKSNTSGGTPGDSDIIYYGYATSTATTAVPFTSDDAPATASPVEIITSYGSSNKSLSVIEVQARQNPGPPIPGVIYGNNVDINGNVTISGNDECSSDADPVPAVAYVTDPPPNQGGSISLESDADVGTITQIPALDLTTVVDELKSIKTVTLTGDQTDYHVDSNSNYEVVYCDATQLSDNKITLTNITGYGTLVVSGKIEFKGSSNWWNGLIIASERIEFDGDGTVYGAILSGGDVYIPGTWKIYYYPCEIDRAKSSFPYATFRWEDKKLN